MKLKNTLKISICVVLTLCICVVAVFSVVNRVNQYFDVKEAAALMAAFSVMPDAQLTVEETEKPTVMEKSKRIASESETQAKEKDIKDNSTHKNEKKYPIQETNISTGQIEHNGFYIKNTTSYDMDIDALLSSELPFDFKDTREAQVLIVHTHTCESYMDFDEGYYYESFYPRTTNNDLNVCAVGDAIAKGLKEKGIGVIHAKEQHDNPSYNGAYDRSYDTIMKYMDKYKEIKVVLDIHRDSMTADDMTRYKPTFTYKGQKGAQIMIMTGRDDGDGEFPTWEDNLKFALKLHSTCEQKYPGMTRPLYFGDFTYNMNVNSGSLLIEVGTDANTLDEAVLSGKLLSNALAEVLQNG